MPSYKIFETERFMDDLKLVARRNQRHFDEKLAQFIYPQLKREPHFGPNIKKLRNWSPETWRYRVGDWRFFYIIDEEKHMVYMIAASHRRDAYR